MRFLEIVVSSSRFLSGRTRERRGSYSRSVQPEEFRAAGHALIDWIADHRLAADQRPVLADVNPGEVRGSFPTTAPDSPVAFDELLQQLEQRVVPGLTEVQHPMHFGWFPANASLASVLGDITSSGLGNLGISWESSPALTEVEEVVCDWMRQLVGLTDAWKGTIHDTASTACVVALLVARERATALAQNQGGLQAVDAPLVVYTTSEAHSSVAKAALLAGYGWDNIQSVDIDPVTRAMVPESLAAAIEADVAAGRTPAAVVASVGTTGTTAFDPVDAIAEVIEASGRSIWLHVDAAMAGTAMLLPECRHLWQGAERSDSITWNPHKWMGTILDCSLFYVRNTGELESVMSTNPSYLQSTADGEVTQYRDWGIPLGRRFRALKLWFHLELDGIEAIRTRIRRDLDNTAWLAGEIEKVDDWTIVSPVPLQTICVRHMPDGLSGDELDEHTLRWVRNINESGAAYLTPARIDVPGLDGSWTVRISVGVENTERRHLEALWDLMRTTATSALS